MNPNLLEGQLPLADPDLSPPHGGGNEKYLFPQITYSRSLYIHVRAPGLSLLCVCPYVFSTGSGAMAEGEEAMSQEDWKEKCMVLEALLMKFRVQIIKIRELTADKVGWSKLYSATRLSTNSSLLKLLWPNRERNEFMIYMVPV